MANPYFSFKQFTIRQERSAMKVTTDACLFGAWTANEMSFRPFGRILDMGTGTGLLTLMLAQKIHGRFDAVDIEKEAIQEAEANIRCSPWKERIRIWQQDMRTFRTESLYDAVVCNPPFYEKELASPNAVKNLAHHSAAWSLPEVFESVSMFLSPTGIFFLLLPYKRKAEILKIAAEKKLRLQKIVTVKQTPDHPPFRILMKGSKISGEITEGSLIIMNEKGAYTAEFRELLQDYYLYL